jgi:two-component system, response regulator YesN
MRLLLVDDEIYTRQGILGDIAWDTLGITSVLEAKNGQEAFDLAIEHPIDLLLTDVRMPIMNGIELAYKVQALYSDCRIVFMSGYSDKAYLKAAIELNAVRYIEKPLDISELYTALQKSIRLLEKDRQNQTIVTSSISMINNTLCQELTKRHPELHLLHQLIREHYPSFPMQASKYQTLIIKKVSSDAPISENLPPAALLSAMTLFDHPTIYGYKEENYIVIHLAAHAIETMVEAFLFRDLLSSHIKSPMEFVILVGTLVDKLSDLAESYENAVIHSTQLFIRPNQKVIFHTPSLNKPYQLDELIFSQFKHALQNNDLVLAKEILSRLTFTLKHQETILEDQIKSYYYHFLLIIHTYLIKDKFIPLDESKDFFSIQNLDQLEAFILAKVDSAANSVAILGTVISSSCQSIADVIHQNYKDSELSLTTISDSVHLSLSHMCVLFKKETDITVNQYLTHYRIQQSLPYLLEADVKLHYVAYQVGFKDGNYYAKLFKKFMGITPIAYREMILNAKMD